MLTARKLTSPAYYSDARPLALRVATVSSGNVTLTPAAATLTFTGATPGVVVGNNVNLSPAAATLTLSPATPSVDRTDHITVAPASASITITPATPTVSVGGSVTVSPAAAVLTFTTATPGISGVLAVSQGGIPFYVKPKSTASKFIFGTIEGKSTTVRVDWSAKADYNDTTVTSVSWTTVSGTASISNDASGDDVTSALITTASAGTSTIKVTATMADGQIDIVLLKVKCAALPNSSSDYQ